MAKDPTRTETKFQSIAGPTAALGIGRGLVAGAAPSLGRLVRLAMHGSRTVIDLRTPEDSLDGQLAPPDEKVWARHLGVAYHHVPIALGACNDGAITRVRELLRIEPAPIFLHCSDGARAAALVLIHLACDRNVVLGECYAWARVLEQQHRGLAALVHLWVGYTMDERRRWGSGSGHSRG